MREPHEWAIARIPGARLIPLGELERRIGELDAGREVVVHCKAGVNSTTPHCAHWRMRLAWA